MTTPLRVALYGGFGTGNIGNDASLLVAVSELRKRRPGVEVLCVCNAPESVAQRYGIRATAIRPHMAKWQRPSTGGMRDVVRRAVAMVQLCGADSVRMYRIMRGVDVLMVPGMGVMESGSMRAASFAAPLFMAVAAARAARARVALVSIGADTTSRRATRTLTRWTLRLATHRSFRDAHSKACAVAMGAPCAQDSVYPDIVFGLEPQGNIADTAVHDAVGIGVINYRGAFFSDQPTARDATHAAYVDMIRSFICWLVASGLRVKLLPGDLKDEDTAAEIRSTLPDSAVIGSVEIVRVDSFSGLLDQMKQVDCLVVSRYHNIVGAALIAKPVISLNYRVKNGELMAGLGLQHLHYPLDVSDGDGLRGRFTELRSAAAEVARRLATSSREYHHRTEEQWTTLERTVLRRR